MFIMHRILLLILFITSLFGAKYLAVLDLEPESISASEAKILTQRLTSRIIALSDYTVVERANIDKILKEQKFQHSGCTDRECAVEIGQLLNADVTVVGTVSKLGKTYTIVIPSFSELFIFNIFFNLTLSNLFIFKILFYIRVRYRF